MCTNLSNLLMMKYLFNSDEKDTCTPGGRGGEISTKFKTYTVRLGLVVCVHY